MGGSGRSKFLLLAALLLTLLAVADASANSKDKSRNKNQSSVGLFWAPAKDEADLLADSKEPDDFPATHDDAVADEFDGGFPSLDSMLQWAIGNSDPEKLKETAEDVKHLPANELGKRQLELKELMDKMKMPSDAELMRFAIEDLNNFSTSFEERNRALNELLILVEPIDNANDLNKLGGLIAVIRELNSSESELRTMSAWILGKASQNNPLVQKQILGLGALPTLLKMVRSSFLEEAVKALYAVSAIIRNNLDGQEMFYGESGVLMLQEIMSNSSIDIRLRRKSAFLVSDLAECHLQNSDGRELSPFSSGLFLKSVVDLIESSDLDLQEKALMAIRSLLQLTTTEAIVFKEFCDLDGALERMRKQLEDLMGEEHQWDFVKDIEILRKEVELLFQRKMGKAFWVPT